MADQIIPSQPTVKQLLLDSLDQALAIVPAEAQAFAHDASTTILDSVQQYLTDGTQDVQFLINNSIAQIDSLAAQHFAQASQSELKTIISTATTIARTLLATLAPVVAPIAEAVATGFAAKYLPSWLKP